METGSVDVPIDRQHALAVAGENPGYVGKRHRAADAAFVRIKSNDLSRHYASVGRIGVLGPPPVPSMTDAPLVMVE